MIMLHYKCNLTFMSNLLQDDIAICPECKNCVPQKWNNHCPKWGSKM